MLREDNNGFVIFPIEGKSFIKLETGKTLVYLVAFDSQDVTNHPYILSNNRLILPGNFVSDDVTNRPVLKFTQSIDELINGQLKQVEIDSRYFPMMGEENNLSIPLTTTICLGWNANSFEWRESLTPWSATFRDLTHEGKKLYYSIKKLHNNKEVRILTFNCV